MSLPTDKKISIITACKNRVSALKVSLMSWLNSSEIVEVIIVDWNSDEPINYLTNLDPRVKVIRVSDKQYFNQPQPLNLAAKIATGDYILKLDADHMFNPYYNGLETYFPSGKSYFCGQLDVDYEHFDELGGVSYIDTTMNTEDFKNYVTAYSPFVRYLVGILLVKKEYFDAVGGYNENLGDCYAYEDDEICQRLDLLGLAKIKYDVYNTSFIHLPHPDSKRIENFKGFENQEWYAEQVISKLSQFYSGDELKWQVEYALSEQHTKENKKMIGEIKDYYVPPKTSWNIVQMDEQNFHASETLEIEINKLHNFPTVVCMSLEESEERRNLIINQFKSYEINPKFLISKRYSESNDKIEGKYLHTLNDGTKGCCVSHLKAIKEWYEKTNEDYAFFCEDDLSLETVDYWNFDWSQFMQTVPNDFECLQLLSIRQSYDTYKLRERYWDDWGATAYLLRRSAAKKIIDTYIKGDTFCLEVPNQEVMPLIENVLFASVVKTYVVPLFVENVEFVSTFENQDDDVSEGQKNNHKISHDLVIKYWKSKVAVKKQSIHKNKVEKTELENLLEKFSLDTENPEHNFNLGVWYENNGHTAPALSYFLRSAERAKESNPTLAYESLIRGSYCYFKQGTRDGSGRGMLWQAQSFLPNRPEAHFLLARYAERQEWWQDCYSNAHLALLHCDFDLEPLRTDVEYPGKYGLLLEKAISGWWWGKVDESRDLMTMVLTDYESELTEENRNIVIENIKKIGGVIPEKVEFNYPENFDWGTLTYEDIVTIQREVVHEKVYRYWGDVKEKDIVLDIGSSVGAYAISILDQNPEKIYCVEPSKKLIEILQKNCKSDSIIPINYGIVNNSEDSINIFGGKDQSFNGITFNDLIKEYSITHVDYLKIDCEGGEYNIFKEENMNFLLNNVKFMAIEIHLNYDGCREKFKVFRDKYLTRFKNYKVMSCTRQQIEWGKSLDIKDKIFDNNFIDNYNCEFMVYIKND